MGRFLGGSGGQIWLGMTLGFSPAIARANNDQRANGRKDPSTRTSLRALCAAAGECTGIYGARAHHRGSAGGGFRSVFALPGAEGGDYGKRFDPGGGDFADAVSALVEGRGPGRDDSRK